MVDPARIIAGSLCVGRDRDSASLMADGLIYRVERLCRSVTGPVRVDNDTELSDLLGWNGDPEELGNALRLARMMQANGTGWLVSSPTTRRKDTIPDDPPIRTNLFGEQVQDKPPAGNTVQARLTQWWYERYERRYRRAYVWSGKDAAQLKRLLGTLTEEQIKRAARRYLECDDPRVAGHEFSVFASQINRWLGAQKPLRRTGQVRHL